MKFKLYTAALVVAFAANVASAQLSSTIFGPDDVEKGVHCEINKVTLLAKDEASCKAAGGVAKKAEAQKTAPAEPKAK